MDLPVDAPDELERNLADIEFANRWLGGIAPIRREVRRSGARTILDVGSGSADVPLALVRDGRRRGVDLRATCLDRSEAMLAIARRRTGDDGGLTFVCGRRRAAAVRRRRASTSLRARSHCTISNRRRRANCCARCGASRA